MTTAEKVAVASAGAAAVAAVASWASVFQSSRIQKRALEPRLHIQLSLPNYAAGGVRIHIQNTGGGFASEVWYWVREGNQVVLSGLPPHGSLGPGRSVTLLADLTRSSSPRYGEAVVWWRYGTRTYAQTGAPTRKSWSRRRWAFWGPSNYSEIPGRFFDDVGTMEDWEMIVPSLESAD